jgi:hypothetical protein
MNEICCIFRGFVDHPHVWVNDDLGGCFSNGNEQLSKSHLLVKPYLAGKGEQLTLRKKAKVRLTKSLTEWAESYYVARKGGGVACYLYRQENELNF